MKRIVAVAAFAAGLVLVVLSPASGQAHEYTDCWSETVVNAAGKPVAATLCVNAGGQVDTFIKGSTEPPRMIDINLGYDSLGTECWWSTAYETPWVKLGVDGNGVAHVGYLAEGAPEMIVDAFVRGCTSRPTEANGVLESVWELVNRHVHERPEPSFNPDVGITGLETFLEVAVPPPVTDSLVSPLGTTVSVEIKVAEVEVDWGDGEVETFTESIFPFLSGYPDGAARHAYETKTCPTPGGSRCHPSLSEYEIEVAFDWFVQWRVDAGPWRPIDVPNTLAVASYDVDEIVTRSVGNP